MKNKKFNRKMINAKYINWYISLNSSAEMQELRLFPNVKEVQETLSIYYNIFDKISLLDTNIKRDNNRIATFSFGDGVSPRLAGFLSFMTKWTNYSIDPLMREEEYNGKIQRCFCYKDKAESFVQNLSTYGFVGTEIRKNLLIFEYLKNNYDYIFLLFPHSHVPNLNIIYNFFRNYKVWIVNMPCCYQAQGQHLPFKEWISLKDENINSDKNILHIYNNYLNIQ